MKTKTKFKILALLGAFFIASAALAQNPGTVSNHAVPIGKGPGVTGFGSASPGTAGNVLVSNGASADPTFQPSPGSGCVRIWPSATQTNGAAWNVIDAYGAPVSTLGTLSQGVQEAIDYSVNNGQCLEGFGQSMHVLGVQTGTTTSGSKIVTGLTSTAPLLAGDYVTSATGIDPFNTILTVDSPTQVTLVNNATANGARSIKFTRAAGANLQNFISSSATITIPAAEQWSARFYDVNLTFAPTVTGPGLQFDSQMITDFDWRGGQIVYIPTNPASVDSCPVVFKPTNPVPADGIKAITASRFYISNIASPATVANASGVMCANISNGSIINAQFGWQELNGTGASSTSNTDYGFLVTGMNGTTVFWENLIEGSTIHLVAKGGVQFGTSTTNQSGIGGNIVKIGSIHPSGANSVGIDNYGLNNQFYVGAISNQEGTLNNGVIMRSGAIGNFGVIPKVSGAVVAAYTNSSGGRNQFYINETTPAATIDTLSSTTANVTTVNSATQNTNTLNLGTPNTVAGKACFTNLTSGSICINPTTGALGTAVVTMLAGTYTIVGDSLTQALTNKTVNCANNTCTVRIASDVTGLGTGVATALGVNIGSAGAPVLFNGAGGTPNSLIATNVTALNATQLTTGTIPAARTNGHQNGTATNDNAAAGEVGEYVYCVANPGGTPGSTATVTITIASPGVVTWTAHGLTGNSPVVFSTTGALPTGITAGTVYYVVGASIAANTFQIATSIANAIAGTAINTTGSQSGIQSGQSEVPLTTGNPFNVCAISLTAGDWEVSGTVYFDGNAATTIGYLFGSVGTVSATLNQTGDAFTIAAYPSNSFATVNPVTTHFGPTRISISGTTTHYLHAQGSFAVNTMKAFGLLRARRAR